MKQIDFKYDILLIHNDRYEFKKKLKKPLLLIISDIFIRKESWAFLCVPFFALMMFLMNVSMELRYFLSIIIPMIVFLILKYHHNYKDVIVEKSQIQHIIIKNNKLFVYFKNKEKRVVIKIVNLPNDTKDIIDKLDTKVLEVLPQPKLNLFLHCM